MPGMPLDKVGREYAAMLFHNRQEEILADQATEIQKVAADFGSRNMTRSGTFLSEKAKVMGIHVGLMVDAMAQSLVQAYEKSRLPFDAAALGEINAEVTTFAEAQKRNLRQAAANLAAGFPVPNLANALAGQMETQLMRVVARTLRELRIRHHEIVLVQQQPARVYAAATGKRWDVFISHASEDKDGFVRPLAAALEKTGLKVWYDETALVVGDSLRGKIDEGLAQSRYGIVVLSPSFFNKQWPQRELDGLVSKEIAGVKVILPIWHNIDFDGVNALSPMLAGRLAAKSSDGMERVVEAMRAAMTPEGRPDAQAPLKASGVQLQLSSARQAAQDSHVVRRLQVTIVNDTPERFLNYSFRVCLPAAVLSHWGARQSGEEERGDPKLRCFRFDQSGFGPIEPRSAKSLSTFDYCITCGGQGPDWAQPLIISEAVVSAIIWLNGKEYSDRKTIKELSLGGG
jgi:TIR domain-containing protein